MNVRDELARLLAELEYGDSAVKWEDRHSSSPLKYFARWKARQLLAAGYRKPRTITTQLDLSRLPGGAVILSNEGGIFQQFNGYWLEPANSFGYHLDEIDLPATVLYEPEPKP